ncbi:MAG: DUF169 domain-containing protein [bacterium]
MTNVIGKLVEAIEKNVKPTTHPVAVKLAAEGDEISQKHRRPSRDFGNPVAACQGMSMARTFGWTVVLGEDDHACPVGAIGAGHIEPDLFLEGGVAELYQDDPEAARKMEATYPRQPVGAINEIWLSPLARCEFDPDLAVIYGNPGQILVLIHAANYGKGDGIRSSGTGRFGCSEWIAGVAQSGECAYAIPGSGERVFAGTQDHEMCFMVPASKFESLTQGLAVMRKKGMYRYPVPNMNLMNKPKMPEKYSIL